MTLARRKMTMEIEGTILSINETQEFKNKETGEITPKSFKVVFLEDTTIDGTGTKTQQTSIKIEDAKSSEDLKKFVMKKCFIDNINFGTYKDHNEVYQDWFKTKIENIQEIK